MIGEMAYRTKRPRTRHILAFGVGATLAITQLGAGCVPAPAAPPKPLSRLEKLRLEARERAKEAAK